MNNIEEPLSIYSTYTKGNEIENGNYELRNQTPSCPFMDIGAYFEKYENLTFPSDKLKLHQRFNCIKLI